MHQNEVKIGVAWLRAFLPILLSTLSAQNFCDAVDDDDDNADAFKLNFPLQMQICQKINRKKKVWVCVCGKEIERKETIIKMCFCDV